MAETPQYDPQAWGALAEAYERLTFQTNREPVREITEHANALWPFKDAVGILDNGCGPGPIMARIIADFPDLAPEATLQCCDLSEGMVGWVKRRKGEFVEQGVEAWGRVRCFVQDAMDLGEVVERSLSHVMAGWVFFMTPEPRKCLSESMRVLRDGGVLACSGWQHAQWEELLHLMTKVRPDKKMPEMRKGWESAPAMKGELESAGFRDVEAFEVPTHMAFDSLEELMEFFVRKLPFMKPLIGDMTEEEKDRLVALMVERGREMCPEEPGELRGTALVAVGRK